MTEQDKAEITEIIAAALVVHNSMPAKEKESRFTKFKAWISEQGTQQGLIVVVPMLICYFTGMSEQDALKIVYGALLLAFGHNAITKG